MSDLEKAKRDELTAWVKLQDASNRAVEAYRNGLDLAPYLPDIQAARDEWNRVLVIRLRAEEREREEEKLRRMEDEMKIRPVTDEETAAEMTTGERSKITQIVASMSAEMTTQEEFAKLSTELNALHGQISGRVVQKRLAAHEAWEKIRNRNNKKES